MNGQREKQKHNPIESFLFQFGAVADLLLRLMGCRILSLVPFAPPSFAIIFPFIGLARKSFSVLCLVDKTCDFWFHCNCLIFDFACNFYNPIPEL
jgi:ABC-type microcin C transport system permease subunit YejB